MMKISIDQLSLMPLFQKAAIWSWPDDNGAQRWSFLCEGCGEIFSSFTDIATVAAVMVEHIRTCGMGSPV